MQAGGQHPRYEVAVPWEERGPTRGPLEFETLHKTAHAA